MKATDIARGSGALRARRPWAALLIAASLIPAIAAAASGGPSLLSRSTDLGPVNAAGSIEVTLWLKLHDEQGLDSLIEAQQSGKAAYLSNEQVLARHAPSAVQAAKVSAFLKAQGLSVTAVGQNNLFVRASGTVSQVQNAFHVELRRYNFNGRTFRASIRSATLPTELSPLVSAVAGLSDLGADPHIARVNNKSVLSNVHRQTDPEGIAPEPRPLGATPNGLAFSAQCFYSPTTLNFASADGTVNATYQGNRYGAPITNGFGNLSPCGYQPSDIHTAYNLTSLYQAHLDGRGTTIAIVDAFGSTTIANDVQAFSAFMGLPPANLTIVGTPTESNFSGDANSSWATETTLDVEWVHAIAPGAKIVLVVAPTNLFSDLFNGIITAASTPGVVTISNSWGTEEIGIAGASEFYSAADGLLKAIGASGQSVNFSTGDFGDNASQLGFASAGWPASSPYATAVGGVSVVLDANQHIAWQASWGTNLTEIADTIALGSPPLDSPFNEGFVFGGGGGISDVYQKPSWQQALPGQRRLTPDISWVADPYTGVEIIYSVDTANDLGIEVIGGTSASCPMFSALWGIATQHARHRLGQAAPRLYRLPAGAITDVPATPGSPNNVTGTVYDTGGTNPIRASELSAPLQNLPNFISALYNSPHSTRWFVLSFGLDSTLATGPGWDSATGLGTPDPWNFVHAFGDN